MPRLSRLAFALLWLLLLSMPACARVDKGALTPLAPGQLDRATTAAHAGPDDDPLLHARARVEALEEAGYPDLAAVAAWDWLRRAESAWWLAQLRGDADATKKARASLHRTAAHALRIAKRGDDPSLTIVAILRHAHPRRHRAALRDAVVRVDSLPDFVDTERLLDLVGSDEPSRQQIARIVQWTDGEQERLGLTQLDADAGALDLLDNALLEAVTHAGSRAEIGPLATTILDTDPWHIPAQLLRLAQREHDGGALSEDPLLPSDLFESTEFAAGENVNALARLRLRGKASPSSVTVPLAIAWRLLASGLAGDAHALLETMPVPRDPAAANLHAQLRSMTAVARGDVETFERWRTDVGMKSPTVDHWLAQRATPEFGEVEALAIEARRRRNETHFPFEHQRAMWVARLDDELSKAARARARQALPLDRGEAQAWEAICRERGRDGAACFELWAHYDTPSAIVLAGRTRHFHPDFVLSAHRLVGAELQALAPLLAQYDGTVLDTTSSMQTARLLIELAAGDYPAARARLQARGDLIHKNIRPWAWLAIDDLEQGVITFDESSRQRWNLDFNEGPIERELPQGSIDTRAQRFVEGMLASRGGHHPHALEWLLPTLDAVPDEAVPEGLAQAAWSAHHTGDTTLRDTLRHRLQAVDPHGPAFARLQALLFLGAGQPDQAQRALAHALRWHPDIAALHESMADTFVDALAPPDEVALAYLTDGAPRSSYQGVKLRVAIRQGQVDSLGDAQLVRTALASSVDASWGLPTELFEVDLQLSANAVEWAESQIGEATTIEAAKGWATRALQILDASGPQSADLRQRYLWLSLLANNTDEGQRWAQIYRPEHGLKPLSSGNSAVQLLRSRAAGEIDDAMAWDLWSWIYGTDDSASARVNALIAAPPKGSIFQSFACGELTAADDAAPAFPVCDAAWQDQPSDPSILVSQLYLALNHVDTNEGLRIARSIVQGVIAPPSFIDGPAIALGDNLAQPWHQNRAVWLGEQGQHEAAAQEWFQAYAFGLDGREGQAHGFEQIRFRGPQVRALLDASDETARDMAIKRSRLALAEPAPLAALGYAQLASARVPENKGALTLDELTLPDRLQHIAAWAEADLAAKRVRPESVGALADLILVPELPTAESLYKDNPESSLARLAMIAAYATVDDDAAARPLADALITRHPENPLAVATLIPLQLAAGEEDGARALYQASHAAHPDDDVLRYIAAPESITGPVDALPSWVRDPARYDARLARVDDKRLLALAPRRHRSEERAAELFVPITWEPSDDRPLRFSDGHGARTMVITSARASRCQGRQCAQPFIDDFIARGRTVQWVREVPLAGGIATQAMFTNAEEAMVTWVLPSGGHTFTLVFAATVDRIDALVPALLVTRDGFRPLDGVLAPFPAQSLRASSATVHDSWRLRARREQSQHEGGEDCPITNTLGALRHDTQRAAILLDLWLATADPSARRPLLHCARPRDPTARNLATVALLDEDPRVHAFGREAVAAHPTQVDADLRAILAKPLSPPVSAPDYLMRSDLPGRGIVEVLAALPTTHARAAITRLLHSSDERDRTLAWSAARLRPELATDELIELALGGDSRIASEAAYLLAQRGEPSDATRLRAYIDGLPATASPKEQPALAHAASALSTLVDPADTARLRDLSKKVLDGRRTKVARAHRKTLDAIAADHARAVSLTQDPDQAPQDDDNRALLWRDRRSRRALPLRPAADLTTKSLAQVLPGSNWTFARLAAPSLFSSTVADVAGRLTSGNEAVDQRLSDITSAVLRDSGFAALAEGGGLDTSRPIECAKTSLSGGWVCTATVTDRETALAVFGQREWGSDSGVSLPLTVATTAGVLPVALSVLPVILNEVIYDKDDDDDDDDDDDKGDDDEDKDDPTVDVASERVRTSIQRGEFSLQHYSIVDVNTKRISIDSERYLFVGDRLWVFANDDTMEQVLRVHEGPALADDSEFVRLTSTWRGGAALQAVSLGRSWSLGEGGGSMEVVLDDRGLHFRYGGALELEDGIRDIGPAIAQLPPGAISVFAHGLGAVGSIGDYTIEATGPDASRVPPIPLLAVANGVAFGWYLEDGDRLWRRWLAVAPLDDGLRKALRKNKTPPGRRKNRVHGGLCYRERDGHLLVGDCALVTQSAALPPPKAASTEHLRLGHGAVDGAAAAERIPAMGGLSLEKRAPLRALAPLMNVVTTLHVDAKWTAAKGVAVLDGTVGLRLRPSGDQSRVIDDWLASSEGKNAAHLPRRLRSEELERTLNYLIEVPDAEDFARHTLADSPRTEVHVVSPGRVRLLVAPQPKKPVPAPLSPDDLKRLTRRTDAFPSDDPQLIELAESIAPKGTDPAQAARLVSQWVHERITYEVTPRLLNGKEILNAGRGDCTEYATLTVTLLRALDVPAQMREGMAASGDELVAHAWVGYHDGTAWHEIDPTWGRDFASAGHLEMSVLDALALVSLGKLSVLEIEVERQFGEP